MKVGIMVLFISFLSPSVSFGGSDLYLCQTDFKAEERTWYSEVLLSIDGSSLTRIDHPKSGVSEKVVLIESNKIKSNGFYKDIPGESRCKVNSASDVTYDKDLSVSWVCLHKISPNLPFPMRTGASLYIDFSQMRGTYTEVIYHLGPPGTSSFNFSDCIPTIEAK